MSIEIPVSYVETFGKNVHMLAEQRASRLRGTVMDEDAVGESFTVERIGGVEVNEVTSLHGDTPLNSTPHSRRIGYIKDYDVADLIDRTSQVKKLIELNSPYTMRHAGAMGRAIDLEVISALGGSAAEGKNGATLVALPAEQKIAVAATGLTVAKLISARELLDAAEVDDFLTRYLVCSSKQISDLLEDPEVTSSDYNTVKALVKGEVDEYMRFKFIRSEQLSVDGSGDRLCYGYVQGAVRMAFPRMPSTVANTRPDKRNATQIYTDGSWGAVRAEDVMVTEIACSE